MHQGRVCGAAGRVGDRIYMVDGRNVGVQNGPYVDKVSKRTSYKHSIDCDKCDFSVMYE
mgnify:CR=1 FL=1